MATANIAKNVIGVMGNITNDVMKEGLSSNSLTGILSNNTLYENYLTQTLSKYETDIKGILNESGKTDNQMVENVSDLLDKFKVKGLMKSISKYIDIEGELEKNLGLDHIKTGIVMQAINKDKGTSTDEVKKTINRIQKEKIKKLVCILLKKKLIEVFDKSQPEKVLLYNLAINGDIINKYKECIKLRIGEIKAKNDTQEYLDMFEQEILSKMSDIEKLTN